MKKPIVILVLLIACMLLYNNRAHAVKKTFHNDNATTIGIGDTCKDIVIDDQPEGFVTEFDGKFDIEHACFQELDSYTVHYYEPGDSDPSLSQTYDITIEECTETEGEEEFEYEVLDPSPYPQSNGTWKLCVKALSSDYSGQIAAWQHKITYDLGDPPEETTTTTTSIIDNGTTTTTTISDNGTDTTTTVGGVSTTTTVVDGDGTPTSTTTVSPGESSTTTTTEESSGDEGEVVLDSDLLSDVFSGANGAPWIDATTYGDATYEYALWDNEDCIYIHSAADQACDNESSNPECSRVQIRSNAEGGYSYGTYTCRVWLPGLKKISVRDGIQRKGFKRAIGFAVRGDAESNNNTDAIEIYIGFGTSEARRIHLYDRFLNWLFRRNKLASYCRIHYPEAGNPSQKKSSFTVVPISAGAWHELKIDLDTYSEKEAAVKWYIDDTLAYSKIVNWTGQELQIYCSVENLDWIGDVDPANEAGAYFNWIKYIPLVK
jgi:hypothetical protein